MLDDLVSIAAAATRTLAQRGRRFLDDRIEHLPRRLDQRAHALDLGSRHGLQLELRHRAWGAELGGGITAEMVDVIATPATHRERPARGLCAQRIPGPA